MGVSKTDGFTDFQNEIANFAKAFSHPARVAILQQLIEKRACIGAELVEELPLAQATVAQHLKELKRIGLIKGEVDPPKVSYCINEEVWQRMKSLLEPLLASYDSCC